MRDIDGRLVLSASDLMRFYGCRHATALDLRAFHGDTSITPVEDTASAALIQKLGDAHEDRYLEALKSRTDVFEVDKSKGFDEALRQTRAALAVGAPAIFQGAFFSDGWGGYSDFLERVDRPSKLGAYSYEVADTKLKRKADPKHVLQLVLYSDLLAEIQGVEPQFIHVELGDGTRATLRLADHAAYARHARDQLERFVANPPATQPEPVAACGLCRWREHCKAEWTQKDATCLVANSRRDQRRKLEAVGITTVASLATSTGKVAGMTPETLARLRTQARLQHARAQGGPPTFERRPHVPGRGFDRLPRPAAGDLFFDMEGDPHVDDGGLEYLFGLYWIDAGRPRFVPYWAHTRDEEATATRDVIAFVSDHLARHPGAHVYHYNHYETTALKRLAQRHGVGEEPLDQLLRGQKFVDLYRVVQQSLIASEPGYSLKNLEAFYQEKRDDAVTTAGDSIVEYERWRITKEQDILDAIAAYNETDCRSTLGLRDWLVRAVRPAALPWPDLIVEPESPKAAERSAKRRDTDTETAARRARLPSVVGEMAGPPAELLLELTAFHTREEKPQHWARFDRADREPEDLVDDLESLGCLTATGHARREKRSLARRYGFAPQETKLRAGSQAGAIGPTLQGIRTVEILELDAQLGTCLVKFGPSAGEPPDEISLIPAAPIEAAVISNAVRRVLDDVLDGGARYQAAQDLLTKRRPRVTGIRPETPLASGSDVVAAVVDLVANLDRTVLAIQGPPGTGKTYVSSVAILALLQAGKRVAVTSTAHKAIDNLMAEVGKRAREARFNLHAIKKGETDGLQFDPSVEVTSDYADKRLLTYHLVGGTAHLLCRPEFDASFDVVVVDEAGQVSLANAVGVSTSAQSMVLVGDPMQLPQPVQGTHPGRSGESALGYLLGEEQTIAPEQGVFLPVTRRLHPDVCHWVSQVAYEGRLRSHPDAARRGLVLDNPSRLMTSTGVVFAAVDHSGNTQSSREEAEAVAALWHEFMRQGFRDETGRTRPLKPEDVLVVAPYNAQVNLLTGQLPSTARVGTVDKFQGQQAAVCLISMTTSSADELPRTLEFLFSINRLNVAISRAMALAVVFASPRLLEVPCSRVEQMRLVNALCAVAELGSPDRLD